MEVTLEVAAAGEGGGGGGGAAAYSLPPSSSAPEFEDMLMEGGGDWNCTGVLDQANGVFNSSGGCLGGNFTGEIASHLSSWCSVQKSPCCGKCIAVPKASKPRQQTASRADLRRTFF